MAPKPTYEELAQRIRKLEKEAALRKEEMNAVRKYEFIANATDQHLSMIDRNYVYETVNKAYCQAKNRSAAEIVGRSVSEVWGEEKFNNVIKDFLDRCLAGEVVMGGDWFTFNQQDLRYYVVTYYPYYDAGGEITHAVVVSSDITERKKAEMELQKAHNILEKRVRERTAELVKANERLQREIEERRRAEEALRESEERYRTVVEDMPAMVCRFRSDGTLTFANSGYREYINYTRKKLIGRNIFDFIESEEGEKAQKIFAALTPENPTITRESKRTLPNEAVTWQQWTDRALFDDQGDWVEIQSIGMDVTETKELEDQLQQAQKMKAIGTLAGGIAHDFNNLLMGIQGNISLIYLELDESSALYENIRSIEKLVDSGANLTKQLLGFARGGKYVVKPTNLNEIVNRTSQLFGRARKTIRIHENYQKDIWTVEADQGQIEQVMVNLYLNAWQAMDERGDMYLKTDNVILNESFVKPFEVLPGRYVKVSVTDTGKGMPDEIQHRIFEPFFTTREMGCGSGLGLASVFGILKNHGGIIDFSTTPDEGSTFNIYLPVSEKEIEESKQASDEFERGSETILLVDDEDYILNVGVPMLEKLGYQVIVANCGREAMRVYKERNKDIDMVILDIVMPDIDGGEVYDCMRDLRPDVKVLLSSGYDLGQAASVMERGCNGFIQKPFTLKILAHMAREVLDS
jgi:PAS domain S-box-containing protein